MDFRIAERLLRTMIRMGRLTTVGGLLLVLMLPAWSQSAYLVKDLDQSRVLPSMPHNFFTHEGVTYFAAKTEFGVELWKTDGTAEGTVMVKDIFPGSGDSQPEGFVEAGGIVYFSAVSPGKGAELWKTDGTEEGTVLVKEMRAGTASSFPNLAVAGETLVFFAFADGTGRELWTSDGTEAGTVLLRDFVPGSGDSEHTPLTPFNGAVYFRASTPETGMELYRTDGTEAGTQLVRDLAPGSDSSYPEEIRAGDDALYFEALGSIWESDGTEAGTLLFRETGPVFGVTPVGASVYYITIYTVENGGRLWKTDGTDSGTTMVSQVLAEAPNYPGPLPVLGNLVFFNGTTDEEGGELWVSDGTVEGTRMLRDIQPGAVSSFPRWVVPWNGRVYLAATSTEHGAELWSTDGTSEGTALLDTIPGPADSSPSNIAAAGDRLYFQASSPGIGRELWTSDGTVLGTSLLKDIHRGNGSSNPRQFWDVNGKAFFWTDYFGPSDQVWTSDGTEEGTQLLGDESTLVPNLLQESANKFLPAGGSIYFIGSNHLLYQTDGTPEGTRAVHQIHVDSLINVGNSVYYLVNYSEALWKCTGDTPSKVMTFPFDYWIGNLGPQTLHTAHGLVYFSFPHPEFGHQLWRSDGTSTGTFTVLEYTPGTTEESRPGLEFQGLMYFPALVNGEYGLWKTDGRRAGTSLVSPLPALAQPVAVVGGSLFFRMTVEDHPELWVTDGTAEGTTKVAQLPQPANASGPESFTASGNLLYFVCTTEENGSELWKSDGTPEGTGMVKDIYPGPGGSFPIYLTDMKGILCFAASDEVHGNELWRSDGTAEGTLLAADIWQGFGSSEPKVLTAVGPLLFFSATGNLSLSEVSGREPWAIPGYSLTGSRDGAPFLESAAAVARTEILVTFSEALGPGAHSAAHFAISGPGKGTLSSQPDVVVWEGGNRFRLIWNSGALTSGLEVTVHVSSSLTDAEGEAAAPGTSISVQVGLEPGLSAPNPVQRLSIAAEGGGWQLLTYNYSSGTTHVTPYAAANGLASYDSIPETWAGLFLYDYATSRFSEAVYTVRLAR